MSRAPETLLALLRSIPRRPTEQHLVPAIDALIEYASHSRQPAMSAAALIRSHAKAAGLSSAVALQLSASVTDHFRQARRREQREERDRRDHVPLTNAAAMLGEQPADLLAKLIDPAQRRLYGWPYWSGTMFMVPILACRAATRATFLDTLPPNEPAAIAATLPTWCRREGPGERVVPPTAA